MKRYPRRLNAFLCLLTAFSGLFISPALADEKAKRVLILPLTIHSEKDLTFLNQGIMDMMAARIGQNDGHVAANLSISAENISTPKKISHDLYSRSDSLIKQFYRY